MKTKIEVKEFRLKLYPEDFYNVKRFYEYELELPIVHQWDRDESKGVMFDVYGTVLELIWKKEKVYKPIVGSDVSWRVPDVWKLFQLFKNKPYIARNLRDNPWGDTSFHIEDPEGFKITFFSKTKNV
ncbi:hypothetical protein KDA00_05400 [Candidatus Saccharibacteria bacterium]|nr:hypothetical protein [Candidatus Saccharibacteria bacterium]